MTGQDRKHTVMAAATDVLDLLTDQFRTATRDWSRIADELRVAFHFSDDAILAERLATGRTSAAPYRVP